MTSDQLQLLIDLLSASPTDPATPVDVLRVGIELLGGATPMPDDVTVEPVDVAGVPAEWLVPSNATDGPAMLYLHGGGYNIGSLASHRGPVAHLARACRMRALLVDYRLAPEQPFPAAFDDATASYRWLRTAPDVDPARLVVSGESAGGGLALAMLAALDGDTPPPACAVIVSAWADLTNDSASMDANAATDPVLSRELLDTWASAYASGGLTDPRVSPLFGDLGGLPPLLLLAAEQEVLRDDTVRYAKQAEAAGIDVTVELVPHGFHAWTIYAGTAPEAEASRHRIADFIAAHT